MTARSSLVPAGALAVALAFATAACAGGSASPAASAAASPAASASASASAPTDGSPSASASASGSASASASASADVMVTAVDFAFENVPAEIPSGTTLGLTNNGQEVHEMVVVRKLPTTTQSFEELLAMPQDQALGLVQDIGVAFAEPGATSTEVVTTGEAGDYLMVCFIPAGTTSLPSIDPASSEMPSLGTGAPHFTLGMLKEFTVTQ
jgi:plastocyanin